MKNTRLSLLNVSVLSLIIAACFADRFICGTGTAAPADAVVVLAGGRYTEGRVIEGLRLIRTGISTNLIVSGVEFDPQNPDYNAASMRLLQSASSPAVIDARSRITRDTALLIARMARENHWRRIVVVTSEFHWRRTRALFWYDCPPSLEVRVSTLRDVSFENWRSNSYTVKIVRNELWFLTTFIFLHTPYGILTILAMTALMIGVTRWRRKCV